MKKLLAALLLAGICAKSHAESLDLGGVTAFISDAAKSARGGTAVDLKAQIEGIAYLPLRRVVTLDKSAEYAHFGAGAGVYRDGQKVKGEPLVIVMANAPLVAHRLTRGWGFYQNHVIETPLPDIFLGPLVYFPTPGHSWRFGGAVSIGLGRAP